tara:strand:- start:3076 stop:3747 length:672 start_codon:yes stop_codon:yes gene_type:complete
MNIKKKILKNYIVQNILAFITFVYILFVKTTSNIKYINEEVPKKFWDGNKPFILAFWHNQLMMISFCWKSKKKINILASGHSDGRFGAIVGNYFNLNNIQTSINSNALSMRPIFKLLNDNNYLGITPDGPRGPREIASSGIIRIAKNTQIPILTVGFASSKNKKLKSWDKFLVTFPFSKCVFSWSEPLLIPKNLDDNQIPKFQKILEAKIKNCIKIAKEDLSV